MRRGKLVARGRAIGGGLMLFAVLASAGASADVTLAWDPNPPTESVAGYNVYFVQNGGGSTNKVSAGVSTNVTITNLELGATYSFWVTAWNEAGESDPSSPVSYTVGATNVPADGVLLSWDASPNPAVATYRAIFGEARTLGTNIPAGTSLSVEITNLVEGTEYFFTAGSYDSAENPINDYEQIVYVYGATNQSRSLHLRVVPRPPEVVLQSPTNGASFISPAPVTFAAAAADRDGTVARVEFYSGTNFIFAANDAPFGGTVTNLLPGEHAISAVARDDSGQAAKSESIWIMVRPPIPEAPDGLRSTDVTYQWVALSWTDRSTNEAGFRVYRATPGGSFTNVGEVPAQAAMLRDATVAPERSYSYKVVAFNESGESAGEIVQVTTPPSPPSPPGNLNAASLLNARVQLSWQDTSTNEASFVVERSTDGNSFRPLATLSANSSAYTDQNLTPALAYYYRVRAVNAGGSNLSNVAMARLL